MISISSGPVPNGAGPYYLFGTPFHKNMAKWESFQITYHFPVYLVISGTKNVRPDC